MIQYLCKLLNEVERNKEEITRVITNLPGNVLSYLQYVSLYSIKSNKGNTDLAKKIIHILNDEFMDKFNGTITLTYGEVAESHVGMQLIGTMCERGFCKTEMLKAKDVFEKLGCKTVMVNLNDFLPNEVENDYEKQQLKVAKTDKEFEAYVLVIRNGVSCLTNDKDGDKYLLNEMLFYPWDTKLYNERRGIVQNKNARYNLNFDKVGQTANFTEGKGTTIPFKDVPLLNNVRKRLGVVFGEQAEDLKCEGNKYYEPKGTGIGYHGDSERRKVIGVRLGKPMNIHWMWYYNTRPRGVNVKIQLQPGDIYCMSQKAVGTDWKANLKMGWNMKRYTLRHAAGASKYTTKTGKLEIRNQRPYNNDITIGDIYFKVSDNDTTRYEKI